MSANFNYNNIDGWFDPNFAAIYEDRVNSVNSNEPQIFVEVGSWFGKSTAFMGEMIKKSIFRSNIKFYAVDTWEGSLNEDHHLEIVKQHGGSIYNVFLHNMRESGVSEFVNPLKMTSEEASKLFDDQSIDFIFLDANHSYEEVNKDISFWRRKIKKMGGCLAGHDFDWPGVEQAVRENIKDFRLLPPNVWYEFLY